MNSQKPSCTIVVRNACNMADVMRVLSEMDYFNKDPVPAVYWWVLGHMKENLGDRDIFVGIPTDARMEFIQYLHTKALMEATDQQETLGLPRLFSPQKPSCKVKYVVRNATYNMADVTRVLGEMEYFNKDAVPAIYRWVLDHMKENPGDRDVFVGMQSDARRMEFVQDLNTKALMKAMDQQETLGLPPPFSPQ